MPKQRPLDALARLGRRIRTRRLYLQLPLIDFAREVKLSTAMLNAYEAGQAHPPCFTLLRIAKGLGTSTCDLLAERTEGNSDDVNHAVDLFADPFIGEVARSMRRMRRGKRRAVLQITGVIASQP